MFLIKYYYLEIRARFYYCLFAFFLVFISVYNFIDDFFYLLIIPIFARLNKNTTNCLRDCLSPPFQSSLRREDCKGIGSFRSVKALPQATNSPPDALVSSEVLPSTAPLTVPSYPGLRQTEVPINNFTAEDLSPFTHKFIFTDISEAFQASISLSVFVSLFLIVPFILYNIWSFFIPSFYNFERQKFTSDCILFFLIYLIATYFTVNIVFPFFWTFFLNFQEINNLYELECQPRISSYISFLFYLIFVSQILCLLPFFFFLLLKYNYLNVEQIIKKRSIIYLTSFVCVSFLSPPEITSQFLLFFTFIFFFEISIGIQLILRKF